MPLSLVLAAAAQLVYPPQDYTLQSAHDSPKHTFKIETYSSAKDDGRADCVWLVAAKGGAANAKLLFDPSTGSAENSVDISVSPDERWILRTQKLFHGGNAAWLYKRSGNLHYTEVGPPRFSDQAWDFFRQQTHNSFVFSHHFITNISDWPANTHAWLIYLVGDDHQVYVTDWFCYYDLEKQRFYVDDTLVKKNKDAVSPWNDPLSPSLNR